MMSYLILFALIGLIGYYVYSAYKLIKNFIDKKLSQKKATQNENVANGASNTNEQSHGE